MDAVLDFKRAGLGDSPVPKRPVSRADMGAEVIFRRVPPSLLKPQVSKTPYVEASKYRK